MATPITSGLRLWLDANDVTSVFKDASCTPGQEVVSPGDDVKCWQDKSGNSNHALEAAGVPKWVQDGSFNAVEFTSDRLEVPGPNAVFNNGETVDETEIFFVARTRTISAGWAFAHINGGRRYGTHFPWSNSRVYFDVGVCCGTSRIEAPWGGSSSYLHTWNFINDDRTPNYQAIYRDGTLVGSDGVADYITWGTGPFQIGAQGTQYQQINAAEVIIYDRRLTDPEREQVKNYLQNKWKEPVGVGDDWTKGTTKTITAPSGTDRMLIFAVGYEDNNTNDISGITYGGQALTKIEQREVGGSATASAGLWYLDEAGIVASTGSTFNITYTSGAPSHVDTASAVYTNIDQTSPVYSSLAVDDGQSGLVTLAADLSVSEDGLTIMAAQSGNQGTFSTNITTEITDSGSGTSQGIGVTVETQDTTRTLSASKTGGGIRMAMVAVNLRTNTLPEVSSLSSLVTSDTSIRLDWDLKASVPNYRIAYQSGSTAPATCTSGTTIDAGTVSNYTITGLTAGTEYSFRVCSNNGSEYTNGVTISATTNSSPPPAPNEVLGVSVDVKSPSEVDLSWVSGGGGTIGFRVAYNATGTPPTDCLSDTNVDVGNTLTHTVTALSPLTTYSYRVCAYNGTPTYSTGYTGSFSTPGVGSTTNIVNINSSWQSGAYRSDLGSAQNRVLLYIISYESGSALASASFDGQNLTYLDRYTYSDASVEFWLLEESKLALVSPASVSLTDSGAAPTRRTISSVVLENVDQASFISQTTTNGVNNTSVSASLSTENGGLSVIGSMSKRGNATGSTASTGWTPGATLAVAGMGSFTTTKAYTSATSESVSVDFSGASTRLLILGKHFMLADPTAPILLGVPSKSDTAFNLTWTSGGGSTDGFILAYQTGSTAPADCNSGTTVDLGNVTSHSLTGLTANTEYSMRLCAYNVQNDRDSGITLTETTDTGPPAPPNEISSLNANVASDTEITLNWFSGAGTTQGFIVAYQVGSTAPANCTTGTTVDIGNVTAYLVGSLTENTEYSFRVCAYNADNVYSTGLTVSATTDTGGSGSTSTVAGSWEAGLTRSTVESGSNRLLVFVASSEESVDGDLTAVTFGGRPLTQAVEAQNSQGTTQFNRTEIWYLKEADMAAASGTTFNVTWSDTSLNRRYYAHAIFTDIDQSSTVFDTASATFLSGTNPITDTLNVKQGGVSVAAGTTHTNGTYTIGASWTFGSNQQGSSSSLGIGYDIAASDHVDNISFSHDNVGRSALSAVHFQPAEADPNEISALTANALDQSTIDVNWTAAGGTAIGHRVAYQSGATAPANCFSGTQQDVSSLTTFQATGLTALTDYSFRICAYNNSGIYSTGLTVTEQTTSVDTSWTGGNGTNWHDALNWTNGIPNSTQDCTITDQANDPVVNSNAECRNFTLQSPITINNATLSAYSQVLISGAASISETNGILSIKDSSSAAQSLSTSTTIPRLELAKTSGGTLTINSNLAVNNLTYGGGINFTANIGSTRTFEINSNPNIPSGATIVLTQGASLNIPSSGTLTINGGILRTTGDVDTSLSTNPGYTSSQAHIGPISGSGNISINATSGTLDFTGIHLNRLDSNGLNVSGSASISNFNGVHFVNTQVGGSGAAIQLNTTGSVPSSTNYVGFDFATPTDYQSNGSYSLARSTSNCGSGNHTISFINWYGNFSSYGIKIIDNAPSCDIVIDTSASPIDLAGVTLQGYNEAIVIEWKTTAEIMHTGFNIYRSENIDSGYIQINEELILNNITSLGYAGEYRFIDSGVENDKTYYYILEDVALVGTKTQHGPYLGLTDPLLGSVPTYTDDLNEYNSDIDTNQTQVSVDNYIQLADGIKAFYLPSGKIRLQITPGAPVISTSSWNGSYNSISQAGYVSLATENKPRLPFSEILVPIETSATNITSTEVSLDDGVQTGHLIEPVPGYQLIGNVPTPVYSPDATTYATNSLYPQNDYLSVETNSINIDGKNYIKVLIHPALHNPVSGELKVLEEAYIDLDYSEAQSATNTASNELTLPIIEEDSIRLSYKKAGYYKVTYDDLFQAGVEELLKDSYYEDIEITYRGNSLPISIHKNDDDSFAEGDHIIFYAPFEKSLYDNYNHVDLRLTRDRDSERFIEEYDYIDTDADLAPSFKKELEYEANNNYVENRPLGSGVDHFFWQRIFVESGDSSSPSAAKKCFDINTNNIVDSQINFTLKAAAYNNFKIASVTPAKLYLSSSPSDSTEVNLLGQSLSFVEGSIPVNNALGSTEQVCIEVSPFTGISSEYRIIDFDSLKINYMAQVSKSEQSFSGMQALMNYKIPYDNSKGSFTLFQRPGVESPGVIYKALELDNINETFNFTAYGILDESYRFDLVYDSEMLEIDEISFFEVKGDIIDELNDSELLIVTQKDFLDEARDLEIHKESLGIETAVITEKFLHDHFSFGEITPESLRLALNSIKNLSANKLKYVLILNNANKDPKNYEAYGEDQRGSIHLATSQFFDYPSDLHFTKKDDGSLLDISIGRIPVNSSKELRDVVTKIIDFETSTIETINSQISFVSSDDNISNFLEMSQSLATNITTLNKSSAHLTDSSSISDNKAALQSEFGSSLFVNYLGHGSEYELGNKHLEIADIQAGLNNNTPIFVGLNCLTNYYGSSDPTDYGLGEKLVLEPRGGAIASISSNLMLSPIDQANFAHYFYQELNRVTNEGESQTRLGDLYKNAHSRLDQSGLRNDQTDSFIIIGDPSLRLPNKIFKEKETVSTKTSSSNGGGCSAFANSKDVDHKWYIGFIEFLFFGLLLFTFRLFRNRSVK